MSLPVRLAASMLRARPGRTALAALGVAAACAMLGAGVTVGYGLHTGFDRAAERAGMPDALARFEPRERDEVADRLRTLPNLRAYALRLRVAGGHLWHGRGHANEHAVFEGVLPGPRGYALVAGRDVRRTGEAVVERGLAREWGLRPGDELAAAVPTAGRRQLRVVGIAVAPDAVAYPLARGPRIWVPHGDVAGGGTAVSEALLWASDPGRLDILLAGARVAAFGVEDLQVATRPALRAQIEGGTGIVIGLMVAFSVVALAGAGAVLVASSYAEVQRRLHAIGVLRAVGVSRGEVAAAAGLEAFVVALPAALAGLAAGSLLVTGPTARLLDGLNELPPGVGLLPPLLACLLVVAALVTVAAAWPAYAAAGRPPAAAMRAADVRSARRVRVIGAGALGLGVRLARSRPLRTGATALVVALSAAVVLLMLSLASFLGRLAGDASTFGHRYTMVVAAPASEAPRLARVEGVAAAATRYVVDGADSFDLGESFRVVGYEGGARPWERLARAAGEGPRRPGDAEVGQALADALGLRIGATLGVQLPGGGEARLRVAGIVRALENEGRVVYTSAGPLLAADPSLTPQVVLRLHDGADPGPVQRRVRGLGLVGEPATAVDERATSLLAALVVLLRTVAVLDGLVCLYAVAQVLALTAHERRRAVAIVRASGAGPGQVFAVFAGAAIAIVAIAWPVALALERMLLGPAAADLAVHYAALTLAASPGDAALVAAGLGAIALAAAGWLTRSALRAPVVAGLREE